MIIQEMSREECLTALARARLGRLACAREGQPYVVPFYFVHDKPALDEVYLYSFSALGQKIEWMRANPLVCVELDEVTSCDQWMSIVIFGHYEELPAPPDMEPALRGAARPQQPGPASERHRAWQLLQAQPLWWQPGSFSCTGDDALRTFNPIFYRIRIDRMTGRHAAPSPGESIRSTTLSAARQDPGWLRRVFQAFSKPFAAHTEMKNSK